MENPEEHKEKIAELLGRVREILTNSLTENVEIQQILHELEELGMKVNLNFIALVGNSPNLPIQGMDNLPFMSKDGFGIMGGEDIEFDITEDDQQFLKDIGIKFD